MSEPFLLPDVKKILQKIKDDYYLQIEKKPIPVCKGCFNVGESCGTPCWNCERKKAWEEEWAIDLWLWTKYIVWRRKEKNESLQNDKKT